MFVKKILLLDAYYASIKRSENFDLMVKLFETLAEAITFKRTLKQTLKHGKSKIISFDTGMIYTKRKALK